jgi:hypothetical protein
MAAPEGQIQPVKGHQGSEQKGKRPDGKGRSRQFGRGGQPFKKPDPDAVPMLKFGPANNLMRFKEALLKKALEKYGRLGKLINMGKLDDLEEPDRTSHVCRLIRRDGEGRLLGSYEDLPEAETSQRREGTTVVCPHPQVSE